MTIKRMFQIMVAIAILCTSFASTGGAAAWSGCPGQIVVQWGDTMSSIATACGTTVEAILAVNPGIDWWVYAGQILNIPTGGSYTPPVVYYPTYSTYIVQWGDTLGKIAASLGLSVNDILAVNPQIWNPSLIYTGQVINLPTYVSAPPPPVVNYPPPPPVNYPPVDYSQYSTLAISYKNGMIVRSGPGNEYKMINSALYKTEWKYSIYTRTFDAKGQLWVQVYFPQTSKGYTSGWMLVKDHLGNYFTNPQIDP
jgi:LysM repeat protein